MAWGPRPELAGRSVLLFAEDMAVRKVLSDGCHIYGAIPAQLLVTISAYWLPGAAVASYKSTAALTRFQRALTVTLRSRDRSQACNG